MNGNLLTIQEVADRTGLSTHTLRYYERSGLMIAPVTRAANGHRQYSEDDIGWIEFLKKLRTTGMPIREMRRFAELQCQGDITMDQRLAILKAHRRRVVADLEELTEYLRVIEWKIEHYTDCLAANAPAAEEAAH